MSEELTETTENCIFEDYAVKCEGCTPEDCKECQEFKDRIDSYESGVTIEEQLGEVIIRS
jgi:hypothetical protein